MKKGLCLSGGGASGVYGAGAIFHLFDKIEFDIMVGSSVGALNSILLAQAYVDKNPAIIKEVWLDRIRKDTDIYYKKYWKLFLCRAPFSFDPLEKMINELADFEKISKLDKEIIITSIDIKTAQTIYFSNKISDEKTFKKALIAGISIPFFTKPISIGSKLLVDGGIKENAPIKKILENKNIDEVLLILSAPEQLDSNKFNLYNSDFTNIYRILSRVIGIMTSEITRNDFKNSNNINNILSMMTNNQIESSDWLKNKRIVKIDAIQPDNIIIDELLDFNPTQLKAGFDEGIKAAEKYLKLEKK